MRITALVCVCALALAASQAVLAPDAVAQDATAGMGPARSGEMKPASNSRSAAERDPAERSARSIECAQKADARGQQGKIRKHFLHQCKCGV
jgi:hypothetical protein